MSFTDDYTGGTAGDTLESRTGWTLVLDGAYGMQIATGDTIRGNSLGGGSGDSYWTCTDQASANHYTQGQINGLSGRVYNLNVCARLVDNDNYVGFTHYGTGASGRRVFKVISNTITDLDTSQGVSDEWLKIEADGSDIRFYEGGTGATPSWSAALYDGAPSGISTTETSQGYVEAASSTLLWKSFEAGSLAAGALDISPSSISSLEAFGTAAITTGTVSVLPSGIATLESFGATAVDSTVDVSPSGIASLEAFGTAIVDVGAVTITPSGIASLEAFGTTVVALGSGAQSVEPSSITSLETFGATTLSVGTVTISPTGIISLETFGGPTLTGQITLSPSGIASLEAFGTVSFAAGTVTISPAGIDSDEEFGFTVLTGGAGTGKSRWFIRMKGRIIGTINLNTPGLKHNEH